MKSVAPKIQPKRARHVAREAEAGVSGALAGAALGLIGGPPGAVAGAVIGGAVGLLAGVALDRESIDDAYHESKLDREIGVEGGDLGAPCLDHPPAVRGTYSAGASGGAAGESAPPAEGPIPNVE